MHSSIKGLGVTVELDVKDVKLVLHILHWFSNNHTYIDFTLIWMKITEFTSFMSHGIQSYWKTYYIVMYA
jgi:hypothetical protein